MIGAQSACDCAPLCLGTVTFPPVPGSLLAAAEVQYRVAVVAAWQSFSRSVCVGRALPDSRRCCGSPCSCTYGGEEVVLPQVGTNLLLSAFPQLSAKASSAQMSPAAPPPPAPVLPATPRKNKAAMCKPLMQNRGVSCKIEMKSKGCQTGRKTRHNDRIAGAF